MLNFEESAFSNGSSHEFIDWQCRYKVENSHFEKFPEAEEIFLKSFCENYPDLCKDRKIVLIDCTVFSDPGHERDLRSHTGTHGKTFKAIVDHRQFKAINKPLEGLQVEGKNLVINACKSGRHRSVGNKEAQVNTIHKNLYNGKDGTVYHIDLQAETHWRHLCPPNCTECRIDTPLNVINLRKASSYLMSIVPKRISAGPILPIEPPPLRALEEVEDAEEENGGAEASDGF